MNKWIIKDVMAFCDFQIISEVLCVFRILCDSHGTKPSAQRYVSEEETYSSEHFHSPLIAVPPADTITWQRPKGHFPFKLQWSLGLLWLIPPLIFKWFEPVWSMVLLFRLVCHNISPWKRWGRSVIHEVAVDPRGRAPPGWWRQRRGSWGGMKRARGWWAGQLLEVNINSILSGSLPTPFPLRTSRHI